MPYHQVCPVEQFIQVDSFTPPSSGIDFLIQDAVQCPYLTIDISTPEMRRCDPGTYYIDYCNHGTSVAEDAYVEVLLDPDMTFLSSSVPLTSQFGDLYRFDLGDIGEGECGSFIINFQLSCDAEMSQIHCATAHIYPDEICVGFLPNIQVEQDCQGYHIEYEITNLADAFPYELPFQILANDVVVNSDLIFLENNESIELVGFSNDEDATYQLVLGMNSPNYYLATAVSACGAGSAPLHLAFQPNMPQEYEDIHCRMNVGSYDPNDKQSTPAGFGPEHYVQPNTPLEYMIRFQNVGTAAAYKVHIYDTLSLDLKPESFRPGQASHDYFVEFLELTDDGRSVLHFGFDPIYLPDSTSNPEGSQGFVTFTIDMVPDLPLGTVIENKSSIYFDYNDPIVTNTSWLTLNDYEVGIMDSAHSLTENLKISLFPNPSTGHISIDLGDAKMPTEIRVWDAFGGLISNDFQVNENIVQLEIPGSPGMYIVEIEFADVGTTVFKAIKI